MEVHSISFHLVEDAFGFPTSRDSAVAYCLGCLIEETEMLLLLLLARAIVTML